jgi:hypothetical protein
LEPAFGVGLADRVIQGLPVGRPTRATDFSGVPLI